MNNINWDEAATVHWVAPDRQHNGVSARPVSRDFESLANAVRLIRDEMAVGDRAVAWIATTSSSYSTGQLDDLIAELSA